LIIDGDLVKIRRIVQNLLLNAIRYTKNGGVSIKWGKPENTITANGFNEQHWFLDIEDTGLGMPVSLLSKLTEASGEDKQVVGQSSASATGEGIGLFIVKRLCELLSAKLFIESNKNAGTLFRIQLPASYKV
jgi:two-component system CheB/CheR fusion protein